MISHRAVSLLMVLQSWAGGAMLTASPFPRLMHWFLEAGKPQASISSMQSQPGLALAAPGRGLCLGKGIRSQASLEQEGTHSTIPSHRASPALPIPSSLKGPNRRTELAEGSAEPVSQRGCERAGREALPTPKRPLGQPWLHGW